MHAGVMRPVRPLHQAAEAMDQQSPILIKSQNMPCDVPSANFQNFLSYHWVQDRPPLATKRHETKISQWSCVLEDDCYQLSTQKTCLWMRRQFIPGVAVALLQGLVPACHSSRTHQQLEGVLQGVFAV